MYVHLFKSKLKTVQLDAKFQLCDYGCSATKGQEEVLAQDFDQVAIVPGDGNPNPFAVRWKNQCVKFARHRPAGVVGDVLLMTLSKHCCWWHYSMTCQLRLSNRALCMRWTRMESFGALKSARLLKAHMMRTKGWPWYTLILQEFLLPFFFSPDHLRFLKDVIVLSFDSQTDSSIRF